MTRVTCGLAARIPLNPWHGTRHALFSYPPKPFHLHPNPATMSAETLRYRGCLVGHSDWVTAIAAPVETSSNIILSASRCVPAGSIVCACLLALYRPRLQSELLKHRLPRTRPATKLSFGLKSTTGYLVWLRSAAWCPQATFRVSHEARPYCSPGVASTPSDPTL